MTVCVQLGSLQSGSPQSTIYSPKQRSVLNFWSLYISFCSMRVVMKKDMKVTFSVILSEQFNPFLFIPNASIVGDEWGMVNTSFAYVRDVRTNPNGNRIMKYNECQMKNEKIILKNSCTCPCNYSLYIVFHKLKWIIKVKKKPVIFGNGVQITMYI